MSTVYRLVVCEAHGSGRSSAISRSNKRNVMATRKKKLWRKEGGLILWNQIHIHMGLFFLNIHSVEGVRM